MVEIAAQALSTDPDVGLPAVAALREQIEELECTQVSQALRCGWSWAEIGEALGVTKQAVHHKHANRPLAPPPPDQTHREMITERAREVVFLARKEAAGRHDAIVGTDHLLLGLLQCGAGRAADALASLGVTLNAARMQADQFATTTGATPSDAEQLPISAGLRQALERAAVEMTQRKDEQIDTEHLLLALIREPESSAVRLLAGLGVSPADVEAAVGVEAAVR